MIFLDFGYFFLDSDYIIDCVSIYIYIYSTQSLTKEVLLNSEIKQNIHTILRRPILTRESRENDNSEKDEYEKG